MNIVLKFEKSVGLGDLYNKTGNGVFPSKITLASPLVVKPEGTIVSHFFSVWFREFI